MSETEKKIGDLTVRIERDSCIGSGNCVKVAGDLFALDDEGIAVFAPGAEQTPTDAVVEACRICPVEALIATDPSGKRLAP